jgi:ribosomal-protein-alanine N-acetyltransferase
MFRAFGKPWEAKLGPVATVLGSVELRPLRRGDGESWSLLRLADEAQIKRWDPTSASTWTQRHSPAAWREHFSAMSAAARRGRALPFAVLVQGTFAGQVTIAGIEGAPVHSGWVGYWIGSRFTNAGVATIAVSLAVAHALGPGMLHRVDATVAPDNLASRRVLEHLGFRLEGLLQRYLDINGAWRDHQLWALTVEDIPGGRAELLARAQAALPARNR